MSTYEYINYGWQVIDHNVAKREFEEYQGNIPSIEELIRRINEPDPLTESAKRKLEFYRQRRFIEEQYRNGCLIQYE